MAVYDKNGNPLTAVYDKSGNRLLQAYDKNGNPLMGDPEPTDIVAMTYNVQWFTGLSSNQSMQEEILGTYEADIIGMQEFQRQTSTHIPAMATTLLSADYPYLEMGNYGNKNALASKFAMTGFTTVPHTTQTMDGQSYSTAHINIDGKDILLVVAHVTTSTYESTKVEQIREVFDAVQDAEYFIIMADFNTVCKSVNDTEYTTIMKQFVDAGYNCANCTPQFGFNDTWTDGSTAGGTWYPCDNIITSASIDINNVIIDTTKIDVASETGQSIDHLPIIAYLTIN